jgi:hypothetical protein
MSWRGVVERSETGGLGMTLARARMVLGLHFFDQSLHSLVLSHYALRPTVRTDASLNLIHVRAPLSLLPDLTSLPSAPLGVIVALLRNQLSPPWRSVVNCLQQIDLTSMPVSSLSGQYRRCLRCRIVGSTSISQPDNALLVRCDVRSRGPLDWRGPVLQAVYVLSRWWLVVILRQCAEIRSWRHSYTFPFRRL